MTAKNFRLCHNQQLTAVLRETCDGILFVHMLVSMGGGRFLVGIVILHKRGSLF